METVGAVAAPLTILVGLLYYFGRLRTDSYFRKLGVEPRLLGFSREEYLLSSATVAYRPVAALLVASAAAVVGTAAIRHLFRTASRQDQRRAALAAVSVGLLAIAAAGVVFIGPWTGGLQLAAVVLVGSGALLFEAGATLASVGNMSRARRAVVAGVTIVACFWGIAIYAHQSGVGVAERWMAEEPSRFPAVTLYSRDDLPLEGPTVDVSLVGSDESSETRFRYRGLRLLFYGNDRWFLLADAEGRDEDRTTPATVILRDSADLVVVVHPGGDPLASSAGA